MEFVFASIHFYCAVHAFIVAKINFEKKYMQCEAIPTITYHQNIYILRIT